MEERNTQKKEHRGKEHYSMHILNMKDNRNIQREIDKVEKERKNGGEA